MNDFFPTLILGHFIGDYLLQNKWMAMNKSGSTWKCAVHCLIYTLAVTLTTWSSIHSWSWSLFIFLSHFPIDRWSLADKWLDLINGRSLRDFIVNGKKDIPTDLDYENYHTLRAGFTALVYVAADNTMHLVTMYYGGKLLWV
jgi:hypothetical protein